MTTTPGIIAQKLPARFIVIAPPITVAAITTTAMIAVATPSLNRYPRSAPPETGTPIHIAHPLFPSPSPNTATLENVNPTAINTPGSQYATRSNGGERVNVV